MDQRRHPNLVRTWTVGEAEFQIAEGSVRRRGEESDPPAPANQRWPVDTAHTGMVRR